ncbi:heterokaryon incompatibility protein-domain-containing protein [Cadophora sp. MPI-SDFR-AT-0126]|nr:heterokaryon incompatibility protein-domain-containing protein [Leotiomycetes sp. MPI-SDFR-AT-0126]
MCEEESNHTHPFSCLDLHSACEGDNCPQHNHGSSNHDTVQRKDLLIAGTIAGLERSADAGCKTCAILFGGLNLPEIRKIWNAGVHQGMRGRKMEPGDFEEGRTRIEVMWGVGTISGDNVVLYLGPHGEKARYTTLSHTWGSNTTFTLTVDKEGKEGTLNSFLKEITWRDIPKTFQDAIIISHELDIEYLWIDSLCIIQNDEQDWEEQSRQMRPIYGNSWLNIAATDSKDSRGGCFRIGNADQTHPLRHVPQNLNIVVMDQPVNMHKDFGTNYRTDLSSPPLLQRGWVFQERLLPSRVVYYAQDELRWECNEMADCQCGGMVVLARFKPYYHQSMAGALDPLPFVWMKIIERYSWLRFTYPEKDRMIALAGVAKEVLNHGGAGEYLAGHWMQDLASQLCWTVIDDCRRSPQYFAPSWSWLSVLGSIEHSKVEFRQQRHSEIDVQITGASCQPSGEEGLERVTSGLIVVIGKILHLQAELICAPQDDRPRYRLWHQNSTLEFSDFKPDYILDTEEAVQIKNLSVLLWGRIWHGKEGVDHKYTFMVLRVAEDKPDAFQRLGIISLPERHEGPEASLVREFADACDLRADIRII